MSTATTSPSPVFSLTRRASSSACASNSFRAPGTLRSRRKVCGSIRFGAEASGTSFTQTHTFIGRPRSYPLKESGRGAEASVSVPPFERANRSDFLRSHRTTARAVLVLLLLGLSAATAYAASVPAVTAFPVVGNVTFTDDFGDPRPGGQHEGNDVMSRRHQPAIAFERGRVEKHVGSTLGTCMLYLHGHSGMTYVYIHLNNDVGTTNDNDGGCRNGVSWAPSLRDGDFVRRGQLVGYVGDSGDADGIQPHLHFEIRRPNGSPINPYEYLRKAKRLLYPRPA